MAVKLNPSQVFWYYPIIIIVCLSIGLTITTQLTGGLFNYGNLLGKPLFTVFGYPIYKPWMYFVWFMGAFQDIEALKLVLKGGIPLLASGLLSRLAIIQFSVRKLKALSDSDTYGSAKWATKEEIAKMPLSGENGVVLGYANEHGFLVYQGDDPIGVQAPTRSGKGVVIGVPTLLYYPESVIVNDIKGELWRLTSGHRKKFTHTIKIDITNPTEGVCWNPLLEIRQESEVSDAQKIAAILIQAAEDKQQNFEYFRDSAESALVAFIIHILYTSKEKTIPAILRLMRNPDVTKMVTIKVMLKTNHLGDKPHPVVEEKARELLDMASSPNQLNGVLSTVITALKLYEDPKMAGIVSRSDFKLNEILNSENPMSLYLVVPPSDTERTDQFFRLLFNLFSQIATESGTGARLREGFKYRKVPNWINRISPALENFLNRDMYVLSAPHKHRCLMLMDEFASLKYMPFFNEGLSFIAGYGIQPMLIYQTPNQVVKYYGAKNTIKDNLNVRVYFAPNEHDVAKEISSELGQFTKKVSNASIIGKRLDIVPGSISMNTQEVARPLMNADELLSMDENTYILRLKNKPPIMCSRINYYEQPVFNRKMEPEARVFDHETGELDVPGTVEQFNWNQYEYSLEEYQQILAQIKAEEEAEEEERFAKLSTFKPKSRSGSRTSDNADSKPQPKKTKAKRNSKKDNVPTGENQTPPEQGTPDTNNSSMSKTANAPLSDVEEYELYLQQQGYADEPPDLRNQRKSDPIPEQQKVVEIQEAISAGNSQEIDDGRELF